MTRRYPAWAPLLTWPLYPVYAWQGIATRLRTQRLSPPADGPEGSIAGTGEPFRLLVVGDSSAAGVGVERFADSLAGQLSAMLAERTGRPVTCRAAGANSAVAAQVRDHVVPHVEPRDWTHVVLSLGTNDMKNFHTLPRFKRDFGTLVYAVRTRFPQARIYWPEMIDMRRVPAMPWALARILDIRADAFNAKAGRLCKERGACLVPALQDVQPEGFSQDGFHASAAGYRTWAENLARVILSEEEGRLASDAAVAVRPDIGDAQHVG
ncbi:SGNH/GDSL hydrolase family protein [Zhengella sp. ZM62]|uniref:SGNH/GDSL hydrolase family protein n=1 Tax=Zhengella sedimenti TaxID=3390035 RepID=UPI0039769680